MCRVAQGWSYSYLWVVNTHGKVWRCDLVEYNTLVMCTMGALLTQWKPWRGNFDPVRIRTGTITINCLNCFWSSTYCCRKFGTRAVFAAIIPNRVYCICDHQRMRLERLRLRPKFIILRTIRTCDTRDVILDRLQFQISHTLLPVHITSAWSQGTRLCYLLRETMHPAYL